MISEQMVRVICELVLLSWGFYITWKNKGNLHFIKARDKRIGEMDEKIHRQRIEIVFHEEMIEELRLRNRFLEEMVKQKGRNTERRKKVIGELFPDKEKAESD